MDSDNRGTPGAGRGLFWSYGARRPVGARAADRGISVRIIGLGLIIGFLMLPAAGQTTSSRPASTAPAERFKAPAVSRVAIPKFPGMFAIWGATGRDSRGHVWFGVCGHSRSHPSAHLFELDPATGRVSDRGNVVDALKRCGVYRKGELQMKIHSRIHQAADGHLYFASMDENNESQRTGKLPPWGGHLWRYRLADRRWEHLLRTRQPLIALAGGRQHVYALGYWGHVLYAYDTRTGASRSVKVGAVAGHISRNLFTDAREHVYVPRISAGDGSDAWVATLVEFDASLTEVAQTPLAHYLSGTPAGSHGITGFQPLNDGTIAFVTHSGRLSQLRPSAKGPAKIIDLGWFHPKGRSYATSLFVDVSGRYLMGVVKAFREPFRWVVYDLRTRKSEIFPFRIDGPKCLWDSMTLLYGSVTRDEAGCVYLAGKEPIWGGASTPLLLKVRPHRRPAGRAAKAASQPAPPAPPAARRRRGKR